MAGATGGISGPCPPESLLVTPKREICPPNEECGGHFGAMSPQITTCAPQTRNVATKRGLCPKESSWLDATGLQFGASDSQNIGHQPSNRGQELFFADFAMKTYFLFFWSLSIAHISRRRPCFCLQSRIRVILRIICEEDLFLCLEFKGKKFLCPSKNCLWIPSHATLAPGLL